MNFDICYPLSLSSYKYTHMHVYKYSLFTINEKKGVNRHEITVIDLKIGAEAGQQSNHF